MNKENRRRPISKRSKRHAPRRNFSVLGICVVVVLLTVILSVSSITLKAKDSSCAAQEAELEAQIKEEKARAKEIKDLEDYVGTDEYIESVAKEKLGLVHEGEIVFKAE